MQICTYSYMRSAQCAHMQFQLPFGITENTLTNFERNLTKATVIGPLKEHSEEVVFYDVEVRGTKRRYLVWRSPSGVKAVMGENGSCCDTGALACLIRERELFGDDRLNILRAARNIPEDISAIPEFELGLETEPRTGEDNVEVCENFISDFMNSLCQSGLSSDILLETIDTAVKSCLTCSKYDASYVADIILSYDNIIGPILENVSPGGLSLVVCRKSSISSSWIIPFLNHIPQPALISAFIDLSESVFPSTEQLGITDALLNHIDDKEELASILADGLSFYELNNVIRREARRSHTDLARYTAQYIMEVPDFERHIREAALLTRDLGLPDTHDLFIRSFMQEPNGKRLIDVKDAHPDTDIQELIRSAYDSCNPSVQGLVFFARNGLQDLVAEDVFRLIDFEETEAEDALLLAEVLFDCGKEEVALNVAEEILCIKLRNNNLEALSIMETFEQIFSGYSDARKTAIDIRRSFDERRRIWKEYDANGGKMFSLSTRY